MGYVDGTQIRPKTIGGGINLKLYRHVPTNMIAELVIVQGPKVRVMRNPLDGVFQNVTDEEWSEWEEILEEE